MNNYIKKYLLDDDIELDILSNDLLDVDKIENNNLVVNEHLTKKEIVIEITIEDDDLDFLDEDFEYIDEDSTDSDK